MAWTKIEANASLMLESQWILRAENAPVCSLKRGETQGTWVASLLNRTGISCVIQHMARSTLEEAKRECEETLREMGWSIKNEMDKGRQDRAPSRVR